MVLYEDEQVKGTRTYGPHMLLLACVADRVGGSSWELRASIDARPKKGDGNLKKVLDENGADLANAGPLFALFDHDKVRACYGLAQEACKRDLLQAIRAHTKGAPTVVLLEQNMEDLVNACCTAMGLPRPNAKPKPLQRDQIVQRAAAAQATVRAEILATMPSFKRLVEAVLVAHTALSAP
jgi:hypothetical protein